MHREPFPQRMPDRDTALTGAPPERVGLTISPLTFMVIVLVQGVLLAGTAVSLTLFVAQPELLQRLVGKPAFDQGRALASVGGQWPSRAVSIAASGPLRAEAGRHTALGVRLLPADGEEESCLVMQDVEGNEFCLD